ncbi:dihydroxy-acid dehydratase [Variovorax boronicumulans]|uniref:IlvD/Edd family dehydratase n=1 Tax=Variovorax boronicumulans TaxID=436515 RepID=UPI00278B93D8|nr:IlvD/Edd family dehydratase [Variovorax boronicumulans]MDP9908741.1 dihydroxy-acid dehydratase [Variovorax boronicumulans]
MTTPRPLRSAAWFNNPEHSELSVLHLAWFLNYGLTREELQSGKPIIGIAQSGSDLTPCNRHHRELSLRVREGIREMGGIAMEFPMHPIQENGRRPTAALDRNLAYLGLVEILTGYPIDGVVLTTGCDKTTPAALMAAATANIPAIVLSGGPMLNGWHEGQRTGTGTTLFKARELFAKGSIDFPGYIDLVGSTVPSAGHCNVMGTASTMNALAEALGMSLPGCAAIPAPYRERGQMAYETGRRIVDMVREDLKPSDILTRSAFENAIVVNSAIGGSTNAPIHLIAIAKHAGVELNIQDWETVGLDVPLLLDMQPAGKYLGEEFYRAGGVPAVVAELHRHGLIRTDARTVNGHTLAVNCADAPVKDADVIRPFDQPLRENAGFLVMSGNLFDSAIMKTSVISDEFRARYLSQAGDLDAFVGRAIVFDGPEDFEARIEDPSLDIDASCILFMRGVGPIGHPGSSEVVNMRAPSHLLKSGVSALPCIGDGRQSGTSGSPSILNASPEAAAGTGLALLQTGDKVRVDLKERTVNMLVDDAVLQARARDLEAKGGYPIPASQTPWQEIQRAMVDTLSEGMVLKPATKYQRVAQTAGIPRRNH